MNQYLLDTNICVFFLWGKHGIDKKIERVGNDNCLVSEITIAELKFGAENSSNPVKNRNIVAEFQQRFGIIPIFTSLDVYAKEKARLRKKGKSLDDFDLLIGATAITNKLILVTNNRTDFDRMENLELEDWTNG